MVSRFAARCEQRAIVPVLLGLIFASSAFGQPMRLEWGGVSGGARLFRATGVSAPIVSLEGSSDLKTWRVIESVAQHQGSAELRHALDGPGGVWFYRASADFAQFPPHEGFRASVSLHPDGLRFLKEAPLRITFPEIYRDAIKPYIPSAAADCAVGSAVVVGRTNPWKG